MESSPTVGNDHHHYDSSSSAREEEVEQEESFVHLNRTPEVGQLFENLEQAYQFYLNYAKKVGFGVRKNNSKKKNNVVERKEFVCAKEGIRKQSNSGKARRVGETRENCMAKLAIIKVDNKYKVCKFVEQHSHPLITPSKIGFVPSHRSVSVAKRSISAVLDSANVPLYQQMSIFGITAGGLEHVGCTENDLRNVRRDYRVLVDGHDADMLSEYFAEEKEKNPSFYYSFMVDSEMKMTGCFWADALSRRAYDEYADVIVFDTTHGTNRYNMVFAPILGVNNHGQSVLFGSAFLRRENVEHFVWLFEEFKKAMPAGPPGVVITDQDAAMGIAVPRVFPNALHRYCIWHINKKFSEKLGPHVWGVYSERFLSCIWDSSTPDNFESKWMELVEESGMQTHPWLVSLYDIRAQWIPAFVKHLFGAGMSSSQRVESNHAYFKRFVNGQHTFMDFIIRFNRAQERLRNSTLKLDHRDCYERPPLSTECHQIEAQVSTRYTREIFDKFQDEIQKSVLYSLELKDDDGNSICVYWAKNMFATNTSKRAEIVEDNNEDVVRCSCKKFEWEGIPCRHILHFLIFKKGLASLPDKYILSRWCKTKKSKTVVDGNGVEVREHMCDSSLIARRTQFYQLFDNVVDEALLSDEYSQNLEDYLTSLQYKMLSTKGSNGDIVKSTKSSGSRPKPSLIQPDRRSAKDSEKRIKGGKEKAMNKRKRVCKHCSYIAKDGEKGHIARFCPQKKVLGPTSSVGALTLGQS